MRRRVKGTGGEEKIRRLRKTLKNAAIDIRNLVRMSCSYSPFYLLPSPDFLQRGIFPALHPEAHYPALPRERVNNIMQEIWHKASPNNRTPFFSLTPSLTPSPTSSPWASLFPSSSVPSSCNLVLRRELFSSCEVVERFLESHWWEKAPRLVLLPFYNHQLWSSHLYLFFLISGLSTFYPVSFFTCSLCILADGKNIFVCFFFFFKLDRRIDLSWYKFDLTLCLAVSISVCVSWLVLMVPLPVCSPPTSLYGAVEWPRPRINAMERKEQKFFFHPPMDGWDWG